MLPVPITPSTFPASSRPDEYFFFSHLPRRVLSDASGTERASASRSAMVCSATETLLPPGAFITTTPRRVAAARSMLSTPVPARPITRSFGAEASRSAVTFVALRTASASYYPFLLIDAVKLKNLLRRVHPNPDKLVHGRPPQ